MANFFAFPTPHHRAGRFFSRNYTTQYPSQGHHHPSTTPTGTKLSPQHPPQGATGTKLSQHTHNQRKLAISRQQGELFPVPNTAPPSRENFLPQQHHSIPITGTPPPQPAQNPPSNAADNALSRGHESARGTKLSQHSHLKAQPVQNSPHNTRHKARPVQNSPGTPKNNENWPFLASRENYFPFPTPHHRAGRIFSRNNTILVSISTQLTGWSPLSPRHQTNAPLSSALCGLLAAHHDAAPERAGTGRRLADWKWPRHPQASSLHPTTRTNVSDVRPPSSTG